MNVKQEQQVQTAIRLPKSIIDRIDKLAERVSQPGMRATRADALRIALGRGLDELEGKKKR